MINIDYDVIIFKEDDIYIAYCPKLDLSSCGRDVNHAKEMLNIAVKSFLEQAEEMGSLIDILEEAKYQKNSSGRWVPPKLIATELVSA